ncbi:MAG: homoserine dehydrogenase [Christensenellaceae bacterium]
MKVAVLGCGTIGKGVVDMLVSGVKGMTLAKILDRKEKFLPELIEYYTDNYDDILNDDSIDTVVETMGGKGFSYVCVKSALEHKKNVVTANKELISYYMDELSEIADKNGVYLMYEASVGGGIPFMKTVSQLSEINLTKSIVGILNGTTNYVLSSMQNDGLSYDEALKNAQKLGFAEADPSNDVLGLDLVRKISILAMLCYKQSVNPDNVYHFGITNVTKDYIDFIKERNLKLKFVCFANYNKNLEIGVEPVLVSKDNPLYNIEYENNMVIFDLVPNDKITFIGKGAGRLPTATAVVSDLLVIRDKGPKMSYANEFERALCFNDKLVSAIVLKDGKITELEGASARELRNSDYDFYAIKQ